MYESFPTCVLFEFLFDGSDVREEIAMRETNAFGLRSRSGSKDDLDQIVWFDVHRVVRIICVSCDDFRKVIERQTRHVEVRLRLLRQQEFCGDLLLYSHGEVRRRLQIEWNRDRAT